MDNDKLLKTIGATLETLAGTINTALAVNRPPCETPCASTRCDDNTRGVCTGPETCVRGYIKPLPEPVARGMRAPGPGGPLVSGAPCLNVCYNCNCRYHGAESNSCMAWAVCVDLMPEDFKELAAEDQRDGPETCVRGYIKPLPAADGRLKCNSGSCPHYAGDGRCTATDKCVLAAKELLQGYTPEQWTEIRKGGYLCQFSSNGTIWGAFVGPLGGVVDGLFICELHDLWNYCRPAQIPGVLRPWFGGDCPVSNGVAVLVKFRDGGHDLTVATNLEWSHIGSGDIIAYMEV